MANELTSSSASWQNQSWHGSYSSEYFPLFKRRHPTMKHLHPGNLRTDFLLGTTSEGPLIPRRYTLTHSDRTGKLFLSVGLEYNQRQISGRYTRLMRDEVLGEWKQDKEAYSLCVYLHVSGGLVFGRAGWREAIFRRELPLVLESIRYGDKNLFHTYPELDYAPIYVYFQSSDPRYHKIEHFGIPLNYK
jgi:hypothetical protein